MPGEEVLKWLAITLTNRVSYVDWKEGNTLLEFGKVISSNFSKN